MTAVKRAADSILLLPCDRDAPTSTEHLALADFQSGLIDHIPAAWNVLSLSLDEIAQHLILTSITAHEMPFIVRLPLVRQNSEDLDEEKFCFQDAQTELRDIIAASDETVHAARDDPETLRQKGAKTKWWQDREALDARLHDLLLNIENIWLGGFRGFFSAHHKNVELLRRLRQTFDLILDKHLPSRRKLTKAESKGIVLDLNVFELFVGLEFLCNDKTEYDESLTDLLYYVVDILQFNGECNAYDEIDFDAVSSRQHRQYVSTLR